MKLKKLLAASLALMCMCGSMVGCEGGDDAVESSLPEKTLETAADKLQGTWTTKNISLGCSDTEMIIDVESDGEVPVELTKVWIGRAWRTDSDAWVSTFERNGSQSGNFYYKSTLNYHDSYGIEYYTYMYCNKNMNAISLTSATYKQY